MLPAQNSGVGGNVGFPDTCNTPIGTGTSPITYPNYSTDATSINSAVNMLVGALPALHQMSKASMTNGMEAGVAHSSYMGMGGYSAGNAKIFVKGMPAESLGMASNGNNYNCSSEASLIPSITVTLFCRRPDESAADQPTDARPRVWDRPLASDDLAALLADAPPPVAVLRDDGTAAIRLPVFHADTPRQLLEALRQLATATALEIDLRDNPGGSLDAALRTADLFLPAGTPLVALRDADTPDLPARPLLARDDARIHLPVTLVVNGGTASAAEAFAAALIDNGRARAAGSRTHGKGAVQVIVAGRWQTTGWLERISEQPLEGRGIVAG